MNIRPARVVEGVQLLHILSPKKKISSAAMTEQTARCETFIDDSASAAIRGMI